MGFGENLRTMRRKKNISQEELAGKQLVNCYKVISMHVSGSADTPNYVLYGVDSSSKCTERDGGYSRSNRNRETII